jgi:predicted alpha/beta hydrolase
VRLHGQFIRATGGTPGLPVLLSPATGVRQRFYLRFAHWLAGQGHDVLVFDYRGVGLSLTGSLRDCKATLAEWGQQDQVAALEWLVRRTRSEQVLLLGHSAGGQMLGLLPNHRRVAKVVGVAVSSGWFGGMAPAFGLMSRLLLQGILPLGARFKGYAPCTAVGLGENLPVAVAREWGQWCAAGGYAANAVRHAPERDFHADVRTPITVFHASDDRIATTRTVADLLRHYPAAPQQVHRVIPADVGLRAIGHIDWFRPSHDAVWPLLGAALKN